jgi:Ca2+-dependent lipid-binding protein
VTPKHAKMTRSTDKFTKMDPYLIMKVGSQTLKTKVHNSGGKNPEWKDVLDFEINDDDFIDITMMDKDVGKDDFVAQENYQLDKVFKMGHAKDYIPMHFKGKQVGKVWMEFNFMDQSSGGQGIALMMASGM